MIAESGETYISALGYEEIGIVTKSVGATQCNKTGKDDSETKSFCFTASPRTRSDLGANFNACYYLYLNTCCATQDHIIFSASSVEVHSNQQNVTLVGFSLMKPF